MDVNEMSPSTASDTRPGDHHLDRSHGGAGRALLTPRAFMSALGAPGARSADTNRTRRPASPVARHDQGSRRRRRRTARGRTWAPAGARAAGGAGERSVADPGRRRSSGRCAPSGRC